MPIWIVTHSDILCKFLIPLLIGFSPEQQRHALNFIEALLVCVALKYKTIAALVRLLRVPHADQYARADFFSRSPWEPGPVQHAVTMFLLVLVHREVEFCHSTIRRTLPCKHLLEPIKGSILLLGTLGPALASCC